MSVINIACGPPGVEANKFEFEFEFELENE
jgi:hypothetical protein